MRDPAWAGRIGLGLRVAHLPALRAAWPAVDFFELLAENYLSDAGIIEGGPPRAHLDAVVARYPVVLHGVGLGLGSPEPLDAAHLRRLRALAAHTGAAWASDHLCWGRSRGRHLHELLPLPRSREAGAFVAARARSAQQALGLPFAVENVSAYLELPAPGGALSEGQFLALVAEQADVGLLLDLNNLYVSARNALHGEAAAQGWPEAERAAEAVAAVLADLRAHVDPARIVQLHVAGHTILADGFRLDTHDHPVCPAVKGLLAEVLRWAGPVPLVLEWDAKHLPLAELHAHALEARPAMEAAGPLPGRAPAASAPWEAAPQVEAPADDRPPEALGWLLESFADAALLPLSLDGGAGATVPVDRYDLALIRALPPTVGRSAPERLAIYTHQVQARLVEVLQEELPLTVQLLGESAFCALALAALAQAPPRSPLLTALSGELASVLRAPEPPLAAVLRALPVELDLLCAAVEDDRAWASAFSAAEGPPLAPASLPDPSALLHLPMRLQPHLRPLARRWRLLPLRRGEGPAERGVEAVAVWRGPEGVRARSLSLAQFYLLRAFLDGASLDAACAGLARAAAAGDLPPVGDELGGWFAGWLAEGWLLHPAPVGAP
jgi:uncharacterized protein (UPF0276 family)